MSRPSAAKTARRKARRGRTTVKLFLDSPEAVIENTSYGYLRPRRCGRWKWRATWLGRVRRPWLRYALVRFTLTTVTGPQERGWSKSTVVGHRWTKRGAERAVSELRRGDG